MERLFRKSWFVGALILGLIISVFFINLWILKLDFAVPYQGNTFMSLASNITYGSAVNIFAFILVFFFYIGIIPITLAFLSIYKRNSWGLVTAVLYFLGFIAAIISFQAINNYLSVFASVLMIINIIFILATVVLIIFRRKAFDLQESENVNKLDNSKIPLIILLIDVISLIVFLSTFVIPVYSLVEANYSAIIINILFLGENNPRVIIYFFFNFIVLLFVVLSFADALSSYFFNKEKFIDKSKRLVVFSFLATAAFFVFGLAMEMYYTVMWGIVTETVAYIPMLSMFVVVLLNAILIGKYSDFSQIEFRENEHKDNKLEALLYVILLTGVTTLTLFVPIVKIEVTTDAYTYFIKLTGFEILKDYASLDQGYQLVAYLLVVMFIAIGLSLVITLASYFSKYKKFISIVKMAVVVNVFFVFIISVSGYYFQIAKEINQAIILDISDSVGVYLPIVSDFDYVVGTDAIYILIASVAVLILMLGRKVFDEAEMSSLDTGIVPLDNSTALSNLDDEIFQQFDPCYSLTELDLKLDFYNQELVKREKSRVKEASLNGLVKFIVEYAKNSRLHLSYTHQDIATFVAGLGASKLSILQGMSGTGKTSLPKIFSEAIYGNCDIVEVESSWKDKNELLGYYNEFSMKYTPKKFTLALYKAALNQEIFTIILLDEMNLSRIEYYFSDFLSLMENEEDQRELRLINIKLTRKEADEEIDYLALENGNTLRVPPNVWFIGTANRDESTFVISDKVYDRAHTMNFTKRAPKVRDFKEPISKQFYNYKTINDLFITAKENGNFDAENSELIKSVEKLLSPYNISFGNRILKQIEDFVNIYKECFFNENVEKEAIEKILLSKVVSKLEVKTLDDKEMLEMDFEKLNLHQCAEFIKHLDDE